MTVTDSTSRAAGNVEVRKELIAAINARIAAHGWTQAEAAQRIGVSQPRISHLARGHLTRPVLGGRTFAGMFGEPNMRVSG